MLFSGRNEMQFDGIGCCALRFVQGGRWPPLCVNASDATIAEAGLLEGTRALSTSVETRPGTRP